MSSSGMPRPEIGVARALHHPDRQELLNRPVRTALTAFGLAVAIAAVIILVGISWNFERSFMAIYQSKKIDLIVVHAGSSNQLSSSLDVGLVDRLRQIEGVADVAPSLVDTVAFEDKNLASVLVNGWEPESLLFRGIRILEGRSLKAGDDKAVMLGRVLALNLGKKVGDTLDVSGETFQVVGIFESESLFENGALIMPLKTLQKMMGREGQATGLVITATDRPTANSSMTCGADRGGVPGRRGDPRARLRRRRHADPAGQGDGLDDRGGRPDPGRRRHAQHDAHVDLRADARDRYPVAPSAGDESGCWRSCWAKRWLSPWPGTVLGGRAGRRRPAGADALAHGAGLHRSRTSPPPCWHRAGHGHRAEPAGRPLSRGARRRPGPDRGPPP